MTRKCPAKQASQLFLSSKCWKNKAVGFNLKQQLHLNSKKKFHNFYYLLRIKLVSYLELSINVLASYLLWCRHGSTPKVLDGYHQWNKFLLYDAVCKTAPTTPGLFFGSTNKRSIKPTVSVNKNSVNFLPTSLSNFSLYKAGGSFFPKVKSCVLDVARLGETFLIRPFKWS